jgi:ribonuclease HII
MLKCGMPPALTKLSLKEIQDRFADPAMAVSGQTLRHLQRDPRAGVQKLYRTLLKRSETLRREKLRLDALLHFERLLWKAGLQHIAGVDEVGIGPLAGPVVAAAVIFPPGTEIEGIDDSKALDEAQRVTLDALIRARAAAVGIGVVSVEDIDRLNIYHAGLRAMQVALRNLALVPQHVLVDSRTIPDVVQPQNSFDKGDGLNFSIAAASIVAKVYRDRLMAELDAVYPGYGFAGHKGYATREHQDAIRELGPCPIHRRSFDFIRELCGQYSASFYELKARGAAIGTREAMTAWEDELHGYRQDLGEMELKKLQLLRSRVWKRLSDAADD